ncbi:hypothetical protein [Enterococcus cecorum]|uniref:hypothetical protein n=2 Tax=Enterococcus cecorum TaxID=44008 RepID=UPI0032675E56
MPNYLPLLNLSNVFDDLSQRMDLEASTQGMPLFQRAVFMNIDYQPYILPLEEALPENQIQAKEVLAFQSYEPFVFNDGHLSYFNFQHVVPITIGQSLDVGFVSQKEWALTTEKGLPERLRNGLENYLKVYRNNIQLADSELTPIEEAKRDLLKESFLKYFHKELDIEKVYQLPIEKIQDEFSQESELTLKSIQRNVKEYEHILAIDDWEKLDLHLTIQAERQAEYIEDSSFSPWKVSLWQNQHYLGTLAYGENWGNEFNIRDELQKLEKLLPMHAYERLLAEEDVLSFEKSCSEQFHELEKNTRTMDQTRLPKIPIEEIMAIIQQLPSDVLAKQKTYQKDFDLGNDFLLRFRIQGDKTYPDLNDTSKVIPYAVEYIHEFLGIEQKRGVFYDSSWKNRTNIEDSLVHLQTVIESKNVDALYPPDEVETFIQRCNEMQQAEDMYRFVADLPVYEDGERYTIEQNLSGIDYDLATVATYETEYGVDLNTSYNQVILYDYQGGPDDILFMTDNPKQLVEEIQSLDAFSAFMDSRIYDFSLVPTEQNSEKYDLAKKQAESIFEVKGMLSYLKSNLEKTKAYFKESFEESTKENVQKEFPNKRDEFER